MNVKCIQKFLSMNYPAGELAAYLKQVNYDSIAVRFGELNPIDLTAPFKGFV